ncbi:50S ribosomal protein L13 [Enterobacteriaceae endosymbiont of Plateumaris braccata]|uniref:50S ribosomal protein L13 n=1 Tax=Enterobacteriaceae endosymbiont of Plateumaris braccata TaxID=2675793 RepID=UPI001448DFBF|nr:50S ribosomal protein L13 [Enterobacteriaceae endosymbiont of Plateumaris braccata]QJC28403.1 50S ribosomal protein L13 [Enterobacteriaceae endosymbiont of Plateumaris braccata]
MYYIENNVNNYHKWYLIDAKKKILGRLASAIAYYLMGKHKITYSPHIDCGDYITVINAEKIQVTGNKRKNKIYYKHSGYAGGIKKISLNELINNYPNRVIKNAVKGMLPKNKIGYLILNRLKIYSGKKHKHVAQKHYILNI